MGAVGLTGFAMLNGRMPFYYIALCQHWGTGRNDLSINPVNTLYWQAAVESNHTTWLWRPRRQPWNIATREMPG